MPLPGMDRPPLPGPEIQSQMGVPQPPPPGQGLSNLKASQSEEGPAPGAPNPHGFLLAQVDAVKKVLKQIAEAEPTFAPFADKATQIMDQGASAVSTAPAGLGKGVGPGPTDTGTASPTPPPPPGGAGMPVLG